MRHIRQPYDSDAATIGEGTKHILAPPPNEQCRPTKLRMYYNRYPWVLTLIAAVSLSKATILSSVTLSGRQDMNIVFASSPPFAPARAEITIRPHPEK